MIDEHRNQVAHRLLNVLLAHNRVKQLPFLVGGNRRVLPNTAQFRAFAEESRDPPQPCRGASRIQPRSEHNIREGSGVGTGDGGHV